MPGIGRPLPRTTYYDSARDYSIDDSLNRVEYFSNAVMEDTYDAAVRSRGRDDALLRNANATIVSAEYQPSPRRSVVSRRVRASTAPPAPRPTPQQEGVYYRPAIYPVGTSHLATSGLHASHPPLMAPTQSVTYEDQLPVKSSEDKNEVKNEEASSAEDAKKIGGSVNIPAYYACGGDPLNRPVTELRRKMRRMVAAGKKNPNYYRMGLD